MNPLCEAAVELQDFMAQRGWRFCLIGGLAVQRWGEPRLTRDIDLTLMTGIDHEEGFIRELLARFAPRLEDPERFALAARVLLILASNGAPVDVLLGAYDFDEAVVSRATPFLYEPGVSLITCSAEDLLVMKAVAGRPLDWQDVKGIIARQSGKLDWEYIRKQITYLSRLKEESGILDEVEALRAKLDRPNW
ncbi:MAG: nucleotidyl transferase AbiEii/AbiGii toxin family protein [Planctomycetes bacterium]|nr:nucleotidyl transferase AbiEii/AbiGii toxin family protein [Planctomycetota bacterium]